MLLKELIEKSPVRAIEQALGGSLGAGNVAVLLGRHGVGKNAVLVQIGIDAGLHGNKVLHVALEETVSHVREAYTEIFKDLAATHKLEDSLDVLLALERNRSIHTYVGHTFSVAKFRETVQFKIAHAEFSPKVILLDGWDLASCKADEFAELKSLAAEIGAEMWLTGITHREDVGYRGDVVPEPMRHLAPYVRAFFKLESDKDAVLLHIVQSHGGWPKLELPLDTSTLLLEY